MTDQKLRLLISKAVRLDRGIAQAQEKLKVLKAQIAAEAATRPELEVPTEGGGTSVTFEGAGGYIARVTETARRLKAAIKGEDKNLAKIKTAAGAFWSQLFTPETVHVPVEEFRDRAKELLGAEQGKKLIKLCENDGKTTVSFETKEKCE